MPSVTDGGGVGDGDGKAKFEGERRAEVVDRNDASAHGGRGRGGGGSGAMKLEHLLTPTELGVKSDTPVWLLASSGRLGPQGKPRSNPSSHGERTTAMHDELHRVNEKIDALDDNGAGAPAAVAASGLPPLNSDVIGKVSRKTRKLEGGEHEYGESVKVTGYGKASRSFAYVVRAQVCKGSGETGGAIWAMAYNTSGSMLVTGSQDGALRVFHVLHGWWFRSGRPHIDHTSGPMPHLEARPEMIAEVPAHSRDVVCTVWTPSDFLVTAGLEPNVRLWHVASHSSSAAASQTSGTSSAFPSEPPHVEPLRTLRHPDWVTSIAVHPFEESVILTGSVDGNVSLWRILAADRRNSAARKAGAGGSNAAPSIASSIQMQRRASAAIRSPVSSPRGSSMARLEEGLGAGGGAKAASALKGEKSSKGALLVARIGTEDVVTACGFCGTSKDAVAGTATGSLHFYKLQDDVTGDWTLTPSVQLDVRSSKTAADASNAAGGVKDAGDLDDAGSVDANGGTGPVGLNTTKIASILAHPRFPGDVMVSSNDSRLRLLSVEDKSVQLKLSSHSNYRSRYGASFSPNNDRFVLCASETKQIVLYDVAVWNKLANGEHDALLHRKKNPTLIPRQEEPSGLTVQTPSSRLRSKATSSNLPPQPSSKRKSMFAAIRELKAEKAELRGHARSFETFPVKHDKNESVTVALFAPIHHPNTSIVAARVDLPEHQRDALGLMMAVATSTGTISIYYNMPPH
mmetsp:Transcript_8101/g.17448  ORF Transcript_8101/g.17448 Transcript_8101/m.17448 type:complete len:742 (-) Transcript_8101:635-2860(-)